MAIKTEGKLYYEVTKILYAKCNKEESRTITDYIEKLQMYKQESKQYVEAFIECFEKVKAVEFKYKE